MVSQTNSSLCNDNGTPSNMGDDYFDLTITGTVTDGSGNYTVAVNGYTSPSTASGTPVTILGDGTHTNLAADGASTFLVRIEDAGDSNCFVEFTTSIVVPCPPTEDCFCNEYIYLNEPTVGGVHKVLVNNDGSLSEVFGGANGDKHWYSRRWHI